MSEICGTFKLMLMKFAQKSKINKLCLHTFQLKIRLISVTHMLAKTFLLMKNLPFFDLRAISKSLFEPEFLNLARI